MNANRMKTIEWWKWLGVVLMIYVIAAGMLVPLKPGIEKVQTRHDGYGSQLYVNVYGYNTHWDENAQGIRAWLKQGDEHILQASSIEVITSNEMIAQFNLPQYAPNEAASASYTLIVDHPVDGPSILPNALALRRGESIANADYWSDQINDLHLSSEFRYPYRTILFETIRNTFFHVPLWMAMFCLLLIAMYYNIEYLRTRDVEMDMKAYNLILIALFYGVLGIVTGMIWAKYTWGQFWSWDIKQTMALLAVVMFVAYIFIRMGIDDEHTMRRFSSVYGIFAIVMIFPLVYIIPRMAPSLHPGSGGNPAMGGEDMDHTLKAVFYPAIIGYILIGIWLAQLAYRLDRIQWLKRMKG